MAIVQSILAWLQRFMKGFTPFLDKFVIFFLIIFIGFLVGKILGRLIKKILADIKTDEFCRNHLNIKFSIERTLASLIASIIYIASVLFALDAIGFTAALVEILLLIVIVAILLSLLFAIKETFQNAGARFMWKQALKPGAYIRMEETEGEIKAINLLDTVIETRNGDTIIVPNGLFLNRTVKILKRKPAKKNEDTKA